MGLMPRDHKHRFRSSYSESSINFDLSKSDKPLFMHGVHPLYENLKKSAKKLNKSFIRIFKSNLDCGMGSKQGAMSIITVEKILSEELDIQLSDNEKNYLLHKYAIFDVENDFSIITGAIDIQRFLNDCGVDQLNCYSIVQNISPYSTYKLTTNKLSKSKQNQKNLPHISSKVLTSRSSSCKKNESVTKIYSKPAKWLSDIQLKSREKIHRKIEISHRVRVNAALKIQSFFHHFCAPKEPKSDEMGKTQSTCQESYNSFSFLCLENARLREQLEKFKPSIFEDIENKKFGHNRLKTAFDSKFSIKVPLDGDKEYCSTSDSPIRSKKTLTCNNMKLIRRLSWEVANGGIEALRVLEDWFDYFGGDKGVEGVLLDENQLNMAFQGAAYGLDSDEMEALRSELCHNQADRVDSTDLLKLVYGIAEEQGWLKMDDNYFQLNRKKDREISLFVSDICSSYLRTENSNGNNSVVKSPVAQYPTSVAQNPVTERSCDTLINLATELVRIYPANTLMTKIQEVFSKFGTYSTPREIALALDALDVALRPPELINIARIYKYCSKSDLRNDKVLVIDTGKFVNALISKIETTLKKTKVIDERGVLLAKKKEGKLNQVTRSTVSMNDLIGYISSVMLELPQNKRNQWIQSLHDHSNNITNKNDDSLNIRSLLRVLRTCGIHIDLNASKLFIRQFENLKIKKFEFFKNLKSFMETRVGPNRVAKRKICGVALRLRVAIRSVGKSARDVCSILYSTKKFDGNQKIKTEDLINLLKSMGITEDFFSQIDFEAAGAATYCDELLKVLEGENEMTSLRSTSSIDIVGKKIEYYLQKKAGANNILMLFNAADTEKKGHLNLEQFLDFVNELEKDSAELSISDGKIFMNQFGREGSISYADLSSFWTDRMSTWQHRFPQISWKIDEILNEKSIGRASAIADFRQRLTTANLGMNEGFITHVSFLRCLLQFGIDLPDTEFKLLASSLTPLEYSDCISFLPLVEAFENKSEKISSKVSKRESSELCETVCHAVLARIESKLSQISAFFKDSLDIDHDGFATATDINRCFPELEFSLFNAQQVVQEIDTSGGGIDFNVEDLDVACKKFFRERDATKNSKIFKNRSVKNSLKGQNNKLSMREADHFSLKEPIGSLNREAEAAREQVRSSLMKIFERDDIAEAAMRAALMAQPNTGGYISRVSLNSALSDLNLHLSSQRLDALCADCIYNRSIDVRRFADLLFMTDYSSIINNTDFREEPGRDPNGEFESILIKILTREPEKSKFLRSEILKAGFKNSIDNFRGTISVPAFRALVTDVGLDLSIAQLAFMGRLCGSDNGRVDCTALLKFLPNTTSRVRNNGRLMKGSNEKAINDRLRRVNAVIEARRPRN